MCQSAKCQSLRTMIKSHPSFELYLTHDTLIHDTLSSYTGILGACNTPNVMIYVIGLIEVDSKYNRGEKYAGY